MKQTKEQRALIDLVNAFSELCPTTSDKAEIVSDIHKARNEQVTEREICRRVANQIVNGLAYGNWPSILKARART